MALDLYMIGLTVRDMGKALEFYRRLGFAIPERSEGKTHVEVKMGTGLTFFLDSNPARWDPGFVADGNPERGQPTDHYPFILEFYLKEQSVLEAKYQELIAFGYLSRRAPYKTAFGMCFALIYDPDGNTILLSADAHP